MKTTAATAMAVGTNNNQLKGPAEKNVGSGNGDGSWNSDRDVNSKCDRDDTARWRGRGHIKDSNKDNKPWMCLVARDCTPLPWHSVLFAVMVRKKLD
jgi:hypothetical protein